MLEQGLTGLSPRQESSSNWKRSSSGCRLKEPFRPTTGPRLTYCTLTRSLRVGARCMRERLGAKMLKDVVAAWVVEQNLAFSLCFWSIYFEISMTDVSEMYLKAP